MPVVYAVDHHYLHNQITIKAGSITQAVVMHDDKCQQYDLQTLPEAADVVRVMGVAMAGMWLINDEAEPSPGQGAALKEALLALPTLLVQRSTTRFLGSEHPKRFAGL